VTDNEDEQKLKAGELELADTLEELVGNVANLLRVHDRIGSFLGLERLETVAYSAKLAEALAVNDQMKRDGAAEASESVFLGLGAQDPTSTARKAQSPKKSKGDT
jgi:hypothetical protein